MESGEVDVRCCEDEMAAGAVERRLLGPVSAALLIFPEIKLGSANRGKNCLADYTIFEHRQPLLFALSVNG